MGQIWSTACFFFFFFYSPPANTVFTDEYLHLLWWWQWLILNFNKVKHYPPWWLILCVNLTRPDIWSNIILDISITGNSLACKSLNSNWMEISSADFRLLSLHNHVSQFLIINNKSLIFLFALALEQHNVEVGSWKSTYQSSVSLVLYLSIQTTMDCVVLCLCIHVFIEKNLCLSGPVKFKPMLFKG